METTSELFGDRASHARPAPPIRGGTATEPITVGYAFSEMCRLADESRASLRGQHPLSTRAVQAAKVLHAVSHGMLALTRR